MFLASVAASGYKVSIPEAAITAILGYAVVFFGLFLLMMVVIGMGNIFVAKDKKAAAKAEAAKAAVSAAPVTAPVAAEPVYAPGSAGQLKLYDVEPKTAAMIMAIVANQMGKHLNELRFISIKEVK